MYISSPFEGVKIIDDYAHQYLVSVINLEKAKHNSVSTMNRCTGKSTITGKYICKWGNISMDMGLSQPKKPKIPLIKSQELLKPLEKIMQNSVGFSQGLELLTNFDNGRISQNGFYL